MAELDEPQDRKLVRGLSRGLAVLSVLNEHSEASAAEISARTGLPRATVHRLLDTLAAEGFIARVPDAHTYRPTIACRRLSDGYHDELWMRDVAAPVIEELGKALLWPVDIATRHHEMMVIRATTHRSSPLSFHRGRVGWQVPILSTSLGLTYLAFCPETERLAILRTLDAKEPAAKAQVAACPRLLKTLEEVRARGYGVRDGGMVPETGSIAVPVMYGTRCIATINLQYMLSVMTTAQAAERYLGDLQAAASRIETALASRSSGVSRRRAGI